MEALDGSCAAKFMTQESIHLLAVTEDADLAGRLAGLLAKARPPVPEFTHAPDISQALSIIRRGGIDVTLMEITPRTDGQLMSRVVSAVPRMAFMALVAPDQEALGAKAVEDGALDFLISDRLDTHLVMRALSHAVAQHRTRTDLVTSTRMLRSSQANYRRLIAASADGMVIVVDGTVQFGNPAAAAILGAGEDNLVGYQFPFPMKAGAVTEIDLGDERTAEMQVVETEWDGKPALLACLRDVTARRRLNQSLEQANAKLRELDQMKTIFLSKISHELRTPVATIRGFVDNLLEGVLKDNPRAQQQALERIRANVQRLQTLVEDLLEMGRLELGRVQLVLRALDLATLFESLKLDFADRCAHRGVSLEVESPPFRSDLQADPQRIRQVLDNLMTNALKFAPAGSAIRVSAAEESGGWVIISVQDAGPGIPESEQLKIFERFHQIAQEGRASPEGSGLGLSICREIVELHRGTIWVEGAPDRGSRFRFRLPARETRGPQRLRVLVVDDDDAARRTLELTLKRAGLPTEIKTASNGQEAVEILAQWPVQVLFSDIRMPVMDGMALLRHVREHHPKLPMVMVTAFRDLYHAKEMIEAGADEYLTRPFSPAQVSSILDKMRALLAEREGTPA